MALPSKKKSSPALEKREERLHKDLDHDGEKGESPRHRAKVLGSSSSKGKVPPFIKGKGQAKGKGKMKPCGCPFGAKCSH